MTKTILITGAAGGVGGALVKRFIAGGDKVFATDLNLDLLQGCQDNISVTPIPMDIANTESVTSAFAQIKDALGEGSLDAVIHCAAIAPSGSIEFTDADKIETIMNINAVGTFRIIQASLPILRGHDGRLILISSLWGNTGGPLLSGYAASKHAVSAFADSTRRETAGQGIQTSVVELGVVDTNMLAAQSGLSEEQISALSDLERDLYKDLYHNYTKVVKQGGQNAISADKAAEGIEKVFRAQRARPYYRVGTDSKLVFFITKILSARMLDKLFAKLFKTA